MSATADVLRGMVDEATEMTVRQTVLIADLLRRIRVMEAPEAGDEDVMAFARTALASFEEIGELYRAVEANAEAARELFDATEGEDRSLPEGLVWDMRFMGDLFMVNGAAGRDLVKQISGLRKQFEA